MKKILLILAFSLFTYSSNAEEIGLFCKVKITSDEIPSLAESGIKEVYYEKLWLLDTDQNKLHFLSIKENLLLEDGTKKKGKHLTYTNVSDSNTIDFWEYGHNQRIYKFGYAIIDDKYYTIKNYFELFDEEEINSNAKIMSHLYTIDIENLIIKEFVQNNQIKVTIPPAIYKCKKMS